MKVLILGSGGYHPTETRQTTCVMIPEYGIVLDAGTAFFRVRENIKTDHLSILLSHAHLDHVAGLTYLQGVLEGKLPEENVSIYGLSKHLEGVKTNLFSKTLFSVSLKAQLQPIDSNEKTFTTGTVKVNFRLQKHANDSVGYRLTLPDKKVIVFATDTTVASEDGEFVREADLLIHECYATDAQKEFATKTFHSTPKEVYELVEKMNVKKCVLVHINPESNPKDPLQSTLPQNIIIAHDNLEIEI